jgi:hypothetical protein
MVAKTLIARCSVVAGSSTEFNHLVMAGHVSSRLRVDPISRVSSANRDRPKATLAPRRRPQHAQKSPQRDRRNISDPPRCVQAEAIPGPSAAMRWLRRFGERGRRARPEGGDSATGLCATILTACGFHLRATPQCVPCSWSRTPRVSGAARRQARQAHPFAKLAEPGRCAPMAMSSRWYSADWGRSEPLGLP